MSKSSTDARSLSFDEVFCGLLPKLYARAATLTGTGQWGEDAVHEVYLKLASRPGRFLDHPEPSAYAFSALASATRDTWRRERRQVPLPSGEAPCGTWDGGFEKRSAEIEAVRLLGQLPRQQASMVILVDLDGYTTEQAARILGIGRGTAARYRTRAVCRLRRLLGLRDGHVAQAT
ncbi:RNA polymerase sigma factor [Streptomyces tuirus]|uniref:RNA polymerase sigma factor n=1 Tax=Streptomyces tuirus TaxID=68278 RepID=A0A941J716_9ACTN|nr:RNA polymerase sigma factor [Streptomyces tuirus]